MAQIDWKKVESEVKHLYMLPLCTLMVAQNWTITIDNNKIIINAFVYNASLICS